MTAQTQQQTTTEKDYFSFWDFTLQKGEIKTTISQLRLITFLKNNGFIRYKIGDKYIFFQVKDGIAKIVDKVEVTDFVENYINGIPEENEVFKHLYGEDLKADVLEALYRGVSTYFSDLVLTRIGVSKIDFINATAKEAYFFYKNGFVTVRADGYELKPYSELNGLILESQVIKRNFVPNKYNETSTIIETYSKEDGNIAGIRAYDYQPSDFLDFLNKICNFEAARILSLMSMLGYCLHTHMEGKRQAIVLTDSKIGLDGEANGRTGKTLIAQMLGWILNGQKSKPNEVVLQQFTEINGKQTQENNKHIFELCNIHTKLIALNDIKRNFPLDLVYNGITESFTIDKKNKDSFKIEAKLIILVNHTLPIHGDSEKDRFVEFELSDYYSNERSPLSERGRWFGRDWDAQQWESFDNAMMQCVELYLKKGIIKTKEINLRKRKLITDTNEMFYDFAEQSIKLNTPYNKLDLFNQFLDEYPEHRDYKWFTQKKFTVWCQNLTVNYHEAIYKKWSSNSNRDHYFEMVK